jgi:pentapeptide MXKDX repeat protein
MKRLTTALFATMMALGASSVFAQASGAMSNDSMSHDAMSKNGTSHDSMSKDGMSHDSMKKSDKMKKNNAMGMDHAASGGMSQ